MRLTIILGILGLFIFNSGCLAEEVDGWREVFSYRQIEEAHLRQLDGEIIDRDTGLLTRGWDTYEDIMFPGTRIKYDLRHQQMPVRDKVLDCRITGGDAYNNVFFINTIAARWQELDWPYAATKKMVYELEFYVDGHIDTVTGNNTEVEGIEFTFQHILIPNRFFFGIQWNKNGSVYYWDYTINEQTGGFKAWQEFNPTLNFMITAGQWHKLRLEGEIKGKKAQLIKLTLNDQEYDLSSALIEEVTVPDGWVENFIEVGVQLNGNKAVRSDHHHGVDPVGIYLDNVTITGYAPKSKTEKLEEMVAMTKDKGYWRDLISNGLKQDI